MRCLVATITSMSASCTRRRRLSSVSDSIYENFYFYYNNIKIIITLKTTDGASLPPLEFLIKKKVIGLGCLSG